MEVKMNKEGFTLIELLIVIAIIGILAAIAIPGYIGQQKNAARTEAYTNLQNLSLLEAQFFADKGRYSPGDSTATPAYSSPAPGSTVLLGAAGKDHPLNVYDPADNLGRGLIQRGGAAANPSATDPDFLNNALTGFKPGAGTTFSYWIVSGQRFPINTAVNPPVGTNVAAGEPPCFVAFAQGNTTGRNKGETFAIDCNNTKNF
jgi:prepilin-type N-terminal cleavage/methylation domain-containing protein